MATTKYEITSADGWTQVAAADVDCLIENASGIPIRVTFQATAPGAGVAYHVLYQREAVVRVGSDPAYISTPEDTRTAIVVVTT